MRIALVGAGGMGTCHYMNYQHIDGARVVALVGRGESDREHARQWRLPLYDSVTEANRQEEIDLFDVCVPTYLHKAIVLEALGCKKPVICEKPIALHSEDARAMFDAAQANGVQLYIAQVLQFTREVEQLHRIVDERLYGAPLDACFERLSQRPAWSQGNWLFDREKSGLLPFDLHVHDLDVIVSVFGKPDSVDYTACRREDSEICDQYRIRYGYSNGPTVCAEAAWLNACIPFTARWRVYFERGMVVCDDKGLIGYGANGEVTRFDVDDPVKVPCGINLPPSGWFLRELTHFLQCAERNAPSDRVPQRQVLDVLSVLERIR